MFGNLWISETIENVLIAIFHSNLLKLYKTRNVILTIIPKGQSKVHKSSAESHKL